MGSCYPLPHAIEWGMQEGRKHSAVSSRPNAKKSMSFPIRKLKAEHLQKGKPLCNDKKTIGCQESRDLIPTHRRSKWEHLCLKS